MFRNKHIDRSIGLALLGMSIAIPYLVIVPHHFPYLGMSVSWVLLSTIVYAIQKPRSLFSTALYISSLAFAFFFVARANPTLTFFNTVALIYTNAASILFYRNKNTSSLLGLFFSPISIFSSSLTIPKSNYSLRLDQYFKRFKKREIQVPNTTIPSILITLVLLLIIVPLLASANPIFSDLVKNILSYFNLNVLFEKIAEFLGPMNFMRLGVFVGLLFFLPRAVTFATGHPHSLKKHKNVFANISFVLPKIAISIVLGVFFITQIQLYSSTLESLAQQGSTLSSYTREVFAQLSVVTLIVFGLIYNDQNRSKASKVLTYILAVQALFLSAMAFRSDYEYSNTWGFTHKRLYGFAVVFWTIGSILLFLYSYVKNEVSKTFLPRAMLYTSLVLIAVNFANFDRLIFDYAKPSTHTNSIDYYYLSRLSTDTGSLDTHFEDQLSAMQKDIELFDYENYNSTPGSQVQTKISSYYNLEYEIQYLRDKYDEIDPRTFNLSEYRAYKATEELNIYKVQLLIDEHYKKVDEAIRRVEQIEDFPLYPPSYGEPIEVRRN